MRRDLLRAIPEPNLEVAIDRGGGERGGSMASDLLVVALGVLSAFAAGSVFGYAIRSYISRRRRRRHLRNRSQMVGTVLSPPPRSASPEPSTDSVPLVPEVGSVGIEGQRRSHSKSRRRSLDSRGSPHREA